MYKRILVAVDGSEPSRHGLDEAIRLAQGTGATLKLVHVVDLALLNWGETTLYYDAVVQSLSEAGAKVLAESKEIVDRAGVPCEQQLVETVGNAIAPQVVQQARVWGADLIVIGTHGRRGLRRLALGSDAEMVLRESPIPVLMVRGHPEKSK